MVTIINLKSKYYGQEYYYLGNLKNSDRCHISLLFVTITETLTTQQLNNLKALTAGEKALSSTEVMHRYQISSTTSISRSKASLIKNDILDNKPDEI